MHPRGGDRLPAHPTTDRFMTTSRTIPAAARPARPARRVLRVGLGTAAGLALVIGAPLAASAHVHVDPGTVAAGSTATLTFAFSHGCDGSPTTALVIDIPDDRAATLDRLAAFKANALVPGRGAALNTPEKVQAGIDGTRDFLSTLYGSAKDSVAKGLSLKDAFAAARKVMDPKFSDYAIYEHCLPFNVSRAYDEAKGVAWPAIWTAERDREMWAALQG